MKKALIIQNKFIGDVLVASLIAKNFKKIYPKSEVHIFCYDKAMPVLENNPYIDKVIYFDDNNLKKFSELRTYTQQIRKEKYDYLFDPYAKLQSRFISFFSKAKNKISYKKPFFGFIYNYTITKEKKPKYVCCTSIENRIKLLTPIQADMTQYDFQTEIFFQEQELNVAKEQMLANNVDFAKPVFMVGVLGSATNKSLPSSYMAEIINYLIENYDANILLNFVPNQKEEVDEILELVEQKERLFSELNGKNLRELLALMHHVDVVIGNEGGLINMAKAQSVSTFSIFSPHKFREDWGCYENQPIHESVHLEDFEPELFYNLDLKKTEESPEELYSKLNSDRIIPKLEKFLQKQGIQAKSKYTKKVQEEKRDKISALLITYNEEKNIEEYLNDLDFVDEIVIVDSLSNDRTKELAEKNPKVKFIERKFDNFSSQKNFAIQHAQYPWVVFFDTDERIPQELKYEILQTIRSNPRENAFNIRRTFYFINKPMKYSAWQNDKAIRLFRNGEAMYSTDRYVHEQLQVEGEIGILNTPLDHFSLVDIPSYEKKLEKYAALRAKELYEGKQKPNFIHIHVKPTVRFLHHYIFRFGFLDGKNGLKMASMYKEYVQKRYQYLAELWKNQSI